MPYGPKTAIALPFGNVSHVPAVQRTFIMVPERHLSVT